MARNGISSKRYSEHSLSKHNLNDNTELGLQASAFTSKEEEGYDIAGDYWLGDAAEEGGGEIQKLSIARYNEQA